MVTQELLYKNIKTGNLYIVTNRGIDCTNCRDGTPVIIYSPIADRSNISVREEKEFYEKFISATL
jgi:hypothetical protein